ncbi:MAG: hypothetical protein ACYCX4_15805, partial [Bacillota bacterium]
MRSLGLCLGASSVSMVLLEGEKDYTIQKACNISHDGNARRILTSILDEYAENIDYIAVTGRKFKDMVNLPG